MLFNSIEFAIFLPIVFLIYWAIGYTRINDSLKLRLQNAFVVIASYVFYGWWDWRFLLLIALTSFCSWGSGLLIVKSTQNNTEDLRGGKMYHSQRNSGWQPILYWTSESLQRSNITISLFRNLGISLVLAPIAFCLRLFFRSAFRSTRSRPSVTP